MPSRIHAARPAAAAGAPERCPAATVGFERFPAQAPAQKKEQQIGEGSYEASRDYKQRAEEYMKKADVEADAEAAKPRSEQEARDLKQAEEEGRSHSKGER